MNISQRLWPVLRRHRKCYFWASSQCSDIAVRVSGPDFLKQISVLWRSEDAFRFSLHGSKICHTFTSGLFDLITLNMWHMLRYTFSMNSVNLSVPDCWCVSHTVTLTFGHLTLNVCSVSLNFLPNFSEIEQFSAELLRLKYVQFGCRRPSWISWEVDLYNFEAC